MFEKYFKKKKTYVFSVLIFNSKDVEWEELDKNLTIHDFMFFLENKYKICNCNLNIKNIYIKIYKDKLKKLKYFSDKNWLTIRVFY